MLTLLSHKNIVKLVDYNETGILIVKDKQVAVKYIAFELCEKGRLVDILSTTKALSDACARTLLKQIVSGLSFMHSKGIFHRNLSLHNILLDSHYNVKIADLAFDESSELKFFNQSIRSPELLAHSMPINYSACDVFSLGVLLFNLTINKCPFLQATADDKFYRHIIDNKVDEFWKIYDYNCIYSKELKSLITGAIMFKPSQRLTLNEIEHCEWFKKEALSDVQLENEFQIEHTIYSNLKQVLPYSSLTKLKHPNGVFREIKNNESEIKYSSLVPFELSYNPTQIITPSSFISSESMSYVFSSLEGALSIEIGTMGDIEISDSHFEITCNYRCGYQEDSSVELKVRLYHYDSKVYAKFTKKEGSEIAWQDILDKLFHSDILLSLL